MKKINLGSKFLLVTLICLFSCKSPQDIAFESAKEQTVSFISKWKKIERTENFTVKLWRDFRKELKTLQASNKQLGIQKSTLNEEQYRELTKLYGKANAIHSAFATKKWQDNFTAMGTNKVSDHEEIDDEEIKLEIETN